ncbi:glycosyltransferase family 25 protein [Methylobacterium sp. J-026]|uniref:glycosyltransferase family 25 protein n=1 Tax=Methylobacterium sp. J-026 TaxID=2836624 RepID=UPI001FBA0B03|nr:glycosyltransferase family 25 protein [Methylobacterium sp. J-026]MCJ2133982.1 glycosyltransferase family 25 protein [Methylobacterium sp. J-026]
MEKTPAFIISLPEDGASFAATASQLSNTTYEIYRLPALPGSALPDCVCMKLTRDPHSKFNKGALGCMLSHIRVWEQIAKSNAPYALVLEDDAKNIALQNTSWLRELNFDLIFCNDRMATNTGDKSLAVNNNFIGALKAVDTHGHSVGADAYFLSPKGAAKLIERFAEDLYFGHVDVRMAAYCVNVCKDDAIGNVTAEINQIHAIIKSRDPLDAYITGEPLFSHPSRESRRIYQDIAGKARL